MEILYILVAFVLGYFFLRLGLPPLLGYLAGGFILSAYGFRSSEILDGLSHIGVIFLLFSLGLKIRLKNFLQPEVAISGLAQIVISCGLLFLLFSVVGISAGFDTLQTGLLALLLAVASTVVAAKGLEDKGELESYHGRLSIGILVMEDIIMISVLAFTGLKAPSPWAFSLLLLPLLTRVFRWIIRSLKSEELLLLYGILMALGGAVLFESVGLGGELGAFFLGILQTGEEKTDELSEKLWGLREAFLIGFFLKIGLTGTPGWIDVAYAVGLLLLLPLRVGIFFGILSAFRLRARTAFLTAASLGSFSEFALITGAIAISVGLLPESLLITLATVVAISFLFGAPINTRANALYNRLEPVLLKFERSKSRSDAEPNSVGVANYIVVGMGSTGSAAYNHLSSRGEKVVGFDTDPQVLEEQRQKKRRVVFGDAKSKSLWENLDITRLKGVVIAMKEEPGKVNIIKTLRERGFSGNISAMVESETQAKLLQEAGVNTMCSPMIQAGVELAEKVVAVGSPAGVKVVAAV